jgi:hypothetical protein
MLARGLSCVWIYVIATIEQNMGTAISQNGGTLFECLQEERWRHAKCFFLRFKSLKHRG